MNRLAIIITLFLFFMHLLACNKPTANEKLLLGTWEGWGENRLTDANNISLTFNSDYTLENQSGFYKSNGKLQPTYLGTHSQYKFQKDSLFIFEPDSNRWNYHSILKLTQDTLIIKWTYDTLTLTRYQVKNYPLPDFDKIVVSFTDGGRYGYTCMNMIIGADRTISYEDNCDPRKKGFFTGFISLPQYKRLLDGFKHVDINSLKGDYYPNTKIEQDEFTITFVKDGKLIKSVTDYGYVAPWDFFLAYNPLIYLHQSIWLKKDTVPEFMSAYQNIFSASLKRGKKRYRDELQFRDSETFLLFHYILKGKICSTSFKTRFQLVAQYNRFKESNIDTDGRYYKFIVNGKPVTVDIGFNYYDLNASKRVWDEFVQ